MASYEHETRQKRQQRYIKELDTLKRSHSKIGNSRWTQTYLQTLNDNLGDWWDKFKHNYEKLIEVAQRQNMSTDNYFMDYDSTRNNYNQFKESLRFPSLKELKNSFIRELREEYILVPKTKRSSDRNSQKMNKTPDNQQSKVKNVPPQHVVVQSMSTLSSSSLSTSIGDFAEMYKTSTSTTIESYTRKISHNTGTAEGPAPKKFKSGKFIIFG